MVTSIDRAAQQLSAFGIRASNDEVLRAHEIPLEASGYQTIDVLPDGHQDLASQMAAFLAPVQLVFEMDGRGAVFGEEFCELHNSGKTTVAAT